MADARALQTGVLEQDDGTEADRAGGEHAQIDRLAQAPAADQREHRGGGQESGGGQPGRVEPAERKL